MSENFEEGQFFFHYTTSKAAFGHILRQKMLRFSLYRDMRDPLENKRWGLEGYEVELEKIEGPLEPGTRFLHFHIQANFIRERSHLLSFTIDAPNAPGREEDPFNRGWARARMWEQYAENHQGVCLVFRRDSLVAAIASSLRRQGIAPPYHRAVEYGPRTQVTRLSLKDLEGELPADKARRFVEKHHDDLFFRKVFDWAAEHEYRFVTTSSDGKELLVHYDDALAGVIVGERFPVWQRVSVINLCREAKVQALRMDWSVGRPLLGALRPIRNLEDELFEAAPEPPFEEPPAASTDSD